MRRSRTATSSCCGARTPARHTPSSSTTSCGRSSGGRARSWSTLGGPSPRHSGTCGSGSTSARTSRCPTRSRGRSSQATCRITRSSPTPPRTSRSTRKAWRTGRSSAARRSTGVPAEVIREVAHTYAQADRAQICWTLGITEHHNAVDNVLALINLGLLTGHVGKYGSGLNPLRGQNNVQGGGDMGAIRTSFRASRTSWRTRARAGGSKPPGASDHPAVRLAPHEHVPRDGPRRAHRGVLHRREPRELRGRCDARDAPPREPRHLDRAGHRDDEDR